MVLAVATAYSWVMGEIPVDGHVADSLVKDLGLPPEKEEAAKRSLQGLLKKHITALGCNETPIRLHHYTKASVLKSLLTKENELQRDVLSTDAGPGRMTLWASLATHLNDFSELRHGQALIWEEFKRFSANGGGKMALAKLAGVDWEDKLKPGHPWTNIYVACFSEKEDSLGQWRGYAGDRGYALTFEVHPLPTHVLLAKVNYDGDLSPLSETFGGLVKFYERFGEGVNTEALVTSLRRGLALTAALYKRSEWKEEKEWRLVQWCEEPQHTQFRESEGRLIPYHTVPLPEEFKLKGITYGPGFDAWTEESALELLKKRAGLGKDVFVRGTTVSLRIR